MRHLVEVLAIAALVGTAGMIAIALVSELAITPW